MWTTLIALYHFFFPPVSYTEVFGTVPGDLPLENELESITLDEALKCLSPDLVSHKPKNQTLRLRQRLRHPETHTFFSPHMHRLFSSPDTIPIHCDSEDRTIAPFKTYPHPTWLHQSLTKLGSSLVLDSTIVSEPVPELDFRSTMFRLYLADNLVVQPLYQGTRILFKGYEDSNGCHIIEWSQLEDDHAYLKVVSWSHNRAPFPYNDPLYPSFILVVPAHLSQVEPCPLYTR
jgi:hypothetical protein